MGTKFNPLSGIGLDFTGTSGGGGGGLATRYTATFNDNTNWGSPSGGFYTLVKTALTHGHGTTPNVQVFELVGAVYEEVFLATIVNASGDVSIQVTDSPDNRFNGLILII